MEAHGIDGSITLTESHVIFEWKTLRSRLAAKDGAPFESIPYSRVFDAHLIAPDGAMRGCLQLSLIGNDKILSFEENWLSSLSKHNLNHTILYTEDSHFQFRKLAQEIQQKVRTLRNLSAVELHKPEYHRRHG
jgi:hypothetical protein